MAALPTRLGDGPFAIATEGIVKRFGREPALDGVDLQVPEGAVYVLVGPNGAGKSTLLRVLLNVVRPDAGSARVLGLDPRAAGPAVRAQIGYVPERSEASFGWMRVGRALEHHAAYFPAWDAGYARRLVRTLDLRLDARVRTLSKGQARRLQLVLALAHRPPVLLLDEPTDGLDPVVRDEVLGILSEHLADTGCTILISTHLVYEVDRLADHVGVLREGGLVAQLSRERMHRQLRLYRGEVPEGWAGAPGIEGVVLRRGGAGREFRWTVWGEERAIVADLVRAGAVVREVAPLSLDDAVVTLLRAKEMV